MSPIERSAGGGGSGGGMSLLFDSTLAAPAASIDTGAAGIAAGFKSLYIVGIVRCSFVGSADAISLRFNNDSGANYDRAWTRNSSGALSAPASFGDTSAQFGTVPGTTITANYFSPLIVTVPAYTDTTAFKSGNANSGYTTAADYQTVFATFTWRSTTAITRMAIFPNAGSNLITGSRLTIYGTP